MEVLKIGSRGEAVKELQRLLHIDADGVFGLKTDTAVRVYQKEHGLVTDGMVGPTTMAVLNGKASGNKAVADWVIHDPLHVHMYDKKCRKIEYIVIHFTAGGHSRPGRAKSTRHTFVSRAASADFCVDDRDVVQFSPDIYNYATWHCGGAKYKGTRGAGAYKKCTNMNSIGIEMCSTNDGGTFEAGNHDKWSVTNAVVANTVKLVALLMYELHIPLDRVIRHWDVTGKLCPGVIGWNNDELRDSATGEKLGKYNDSTEWIAFKDVVAQEFLKLTHKRKS